MAAKKKTSNRKPRGKTNGSNKTKETSFLGNLWDTVSSAVVDYGPTAVGVICTGVVAYQAGEYIHDEYIAE